MEQIVIGLVSGITSSLLVGVGLWAFLPRGVALTKAVDTTGPDQWRIENRTAEDIKVMRVLANGGMTDFRTIEVLGTGLADFHIDADQEGADEQPEWPRTTLNPGMGLSVQVPVNSHVVLKYRRAGWSGVFDRGEVQVFGTA